MSHSTFNGAQLQNANLAGAHLEGAKFIGANVTDSILTDSVLVGTRFIRCIGLSPENRVYALAHGAIIEN